MSLCLQVTAYARHKPTHRCIAERVLLNFIGVQSCACMQVLSIGGAFAKIPYFLNHGAVHLSMPAVDHSPIKTYCRMNERSGVEQEEYQY